LTEHGAVLFRGCGIADVHQFERLMAALGIRSTDPEHYYGEVVRAGTGKLTLEPTLMPADMVIAPHNECAFWYAQPLFIAFFCESTEARYGQTPLLDCAAVAASFSPTVREKLSEMEVVSEYVFDSVAAGTELVKGQNRNAWQRAFRVETRDEVDAFLAERPDVSLNWRKGDRLHLQVRTGAFARHPMSGETCFRALRAFDFRNLQYMLSEWAKGQLPARKRLASKGLAGLGAWLAGTGLMEHQRYAWKTSLNGPKLTRPEQAHITETIFAHASIFRWHAGDVLVVDNVKTAHARLNVDAPRCLHVYMSEDVDQGRFIIPPRGAGESIGTVAGIAR